MAWHCSLGFSAKAEFMFPPITAKQLQTIIPAPTVYVLVSIMFFFLNEDCFSKTSAQSDWAWKKLTFLDACVKLTEASPKNRLSRLNRNGSYTFYLIKEEVWFFLPSHSCGMEEQINTTTLCWSVPFVYVIKCFYRELRHLAFYTAIA